MAISTWPEKLLPRVSQPVKGMAATPAPEDEAAKVILPRLGEPSA